MIINIHTALMDLSLAFDMLRVVPMLPSVYYVAAAMRQLTVATLYCSIVISQI